MESANVEYKGWLNFFSAVLKLFIFNFKSPLKGCDESGNVKEVCFRGETEKVRLCV